MFVHVDKKYQMIGGAPLAMRVVPRHMLNAIRSSEQIISVAQEEGKRLIEQSVLESQTIAFEAARDAQCAVWQSATEVLSEMKQLQDVLHTELEVRLPTVIENIFRSLLLDVPDEQKIASSIQLVLREWRGERDAVLRVHPDDHPNAKALIEEGLPCKVIADSTIQRGHCTLFSGGSVLQAGFEASIESLFKSKTQ